MKQEAQIQAKICPKCGAEYKTYGAISRLDGSEICPECGTREALDNIGVPPEEQEEIIRIIRRVARKK